MQLTGMTLANGLGREEEVAWLESGAYRSVGRHRERSAEEREGGRGEDSGRRATCPVLIFRST